MDLFERKSIWMGIKEGRIFIFMNFCIVVVGSWRSYAFSQSYWLLIIAARPSVVSNSFNILSTIQTSMCSAPTPDFPLNWLKLSLFDKSSSNTWTKFSGNLRKFYRSHSNTLFCGCLWLLLEFPFLGLGQLILPSKLMGKHLDSSSCLKCLLVEQIIQQQTLFSAFQVSLLGR